MPTLVPLLHSNALDGWDAYKGRGKKQQENILSQLTSRSTQGENQGRWKVDVENDTRKRELETSSAG